MWELVYKPTGYTLCRTNSKQDLLDMIGKSKNRHDWELNYVN